MLIPKKVKEAVTEQISKAIVEKQQKIGEIKLAAYDYIFDHLPWWADFLFENFVATRVDKWVNDQIVKAMQNVENN